MSVKIEFFGETWAEIAAQMKAALGAGVVFEATAAVDEPKAETERRTRGPNKPKETAPTPKPEPDAEQTADSQDTSADDTKAEGLDYEKDIKPLVLEIAGRFGRDKVMEVLAKFGVTNAGHVPVEDQPALMEDIRLVLEG